MQRHSKGRRIVFAGLALGCLISPGCGGSNVTKKGVEGTVSVGEQKPDGGTVTFVPIEGTPGSTNGATIIDGQYRLKARGGMLLGKYRVEVAATKKTGRQVMQDNGLEQIMSDEFGTFSSPEYTGEQSPLVAEITADFNGRFDINIPSTQK